MMATRRSRETSSRDGLVSAARELLSTRGYEATSPADIQRAAGVGQGSFYHHFASKADLASAALEQLADDMCAELDRTTAGTHGSATSPLAAVTAYLEAPRDPLAGCRIGRLAMESSLVDERIRRPVGRYLDHVRHRLSALLDELGASRVDLPDGVAGLADLFVATVQGAYVVARATGDPAVMGAATRTLAALVAGVADTASGTTTSTGATTEEP